MSTPLLMPLLANLSNDLLLICDASGTLLEVGDLAAARLEAQPGGAFLQLLSASSRTKGRHFWQAAQQLTSGASGLPWELHFRSPRSVPLLAGVRAGRLDDASWLLVGTLDSPELARLYQEVLAINNELTTLVRQIAKEQAALSRQVAELLNQKKGVEDGD